MKNTRKLKDYGNNKIETLGVGQVKVQIDEQVQHAQVKVVKKGELLIGRDWIKQFNLPVEALTQIIPKLDLEEENHPGLNAKLKLEDLVWNEKQKRQRKESSLNNDKRVSLSVPRKWQSQKSSSEFSTTTSKSSSAKALSKAKQERSTARRKKRQAERQVKTSSKEIIEAIKSEKRHLDIIQRSISRREIRSGDLESLIQGQEKTCKLFKQLLHFEKAVSTAISQGKDSSKVIKNLKAKSYCKSDPGKKKTKLGRGVADKNKFV